MPSRSSPNGRPVCGSTPRDSLRNSSTSCCSDAFTRSLGAHEQQLVDAHDGHDRRERDQDHERRQDAGPDTAQQTAEISRCAAEPSHQSSPPSSSSSSSSLDGGGGAGAAGAVAAGGGAGATVGEGAARRAARSWRRAACRRRSRARRSRARRSRACARLRASGSDVGSQTGPGPAGSPGPPPPPPPCRIRVEAGTRAQWPRGTQGW